MKSKKVKNTNITKDIKKYKTKKVTIHGIANTLKIKNKPVSKNNYEKSIILQKGGDPPDLRIMDYFIYSSHNTEILTSQFKGLCGSCIIDDFFENDIIGGCIELDIKKIKGDDLAIAHRCSHSLYFSILLKEMINKYYEFVKSNKEVNPLIINFDANGIGICNTASFFKIFHSIFIRAFTNENGEMDMEKCELRKLPLDITNSQINENTNLSILKTQSLSP